MTHPVVEKVAAKLVKSLPDLLLDEPDMDRLAAAEIVAEVLRAVREPSEAMLQRMVWCLDGRGEEQAMKDGLTAWRAGIDALLREVER